MKGNILLTCSFLIVLFTGCGIHSEGIAVPITTQTLKAPTQTRAVMPSVTPPPTPAPNPSATERLATHHFPRLYNQYQAAFISDEQLEDMERLSLWDVITIDPEDPVAVEYLAGPGGVLRNSNPNLVITTYFSAGNTEPTEEGIYGRFNAGLQPNWILQDINGELVKGFKFGSVWSGYYNLAAPGLAEYFADYIGSQLIETELFDGVLYDWGAASGFYWLNDQSIENNGGRIDLNQDGLAETNQQIDSVLQNAMRNLHTVSRDRWGGGIPILGNGGSGSTPEYVTTLNGNMIECFQSNPEWEEKSPLRHSWSAQMKTYASYALQAQEPRIAINLACGRQDPDSFELMRFTLASTLLLDGYYGYAGNIGSSGGDYASTWWYDEYSVNTQTGEAVEALEYKGYLGEALGPAFNVADPSEQLVVTLGIGSEPVDYENRLAETKVWRRDFEYGIVLVNPTGGLETVDLGGTFRKIRGTRDPEFNDGTELDTIALPPKSGVVLLRP